MTGYRSIDDSTSEKFLVLLEAGYLRFTVVEFRVNNGGGSGRGCFGITARADTAELTSVIIAGFGER